ncbi:MAG: ADP-glyceromanno-heptose 6-epimerase [Alphaproteobacteria bacterium]|nr:ADP-glyceromanno-heptose 6-epimerase [Alphaproteobacteria bacterium]
MIVVTGGAGFIGSNLVAALAERGEHEIAVIDRLGSDDKWRNLAKHEIVDLVPPERFLDVFERQAPAISAVLHMGAITDTQARDGDALMAQNFRFSLELWNWCTRHGVRLIYASSAATYGDGRLGFDDEATPEALAKLRPLNGYGWSKHLFDRRVARLAQTGRRPLQWAGLKFFNVYGPNEYHKGAMQSVIARYWPDIAAGRPMRLFKSHRPDYADGGQKRDFVYVKDIVAVVSWLLDNLEVNGLFNLGSGRAQSFREVGEAIFAARGEAANIEYVDMPEPLRAQYQYFTEAKMDRLRAAGFRQPFHSVEQGIADYVRNYLMKADPYR